MTQKYREIYWTDHVKIKMRQYGLSKSKLLQLLYKPERKERGIAAGTTAVMQTKKIFLSNNKKNLLEKKYKMPPGEIWLMYKDVKELRKIISAWRYPGISKPGQEIPIPEDIREELLNYDVS